jgi:YD repeat-containing protein
VERTSTSAPAMNGAPAQTLWARSEYDANGNVTAVERWSEPDLSTTSIGTIRTAWRYDAAGRKVAEIAPGSGTFTDTWTERVCEGITLDNCVDVPHDSTYTIEYKDSTLYDPAGNPVEVHTRRVNPATGAPLVIRMKYDALGRLQERIVPQVHYNQGRNQEFHGIFAPPAPPSVWVRCLSVPTLDVRTTGLRIPDRGGCADFSLRRDGQLDAGGQP